MDVSDAIKKPAVISSEDPPEAEAPQSGVEAQPSKRRFSFDWEAIRNSPAFWPGIAVLLGLTAAFYQLFKSSYALWTADDGYYSHGFLVPLISGYIVYRWWPKIKNIPVKPGYLAALPLFAVLWVSVAASVNVIESLMSVSFLFAALFGIAFVAGWRWMFALALPTLYLAFCLPLWNMAITVWTNPLQVLSTKMAYHMLELTGFNPIRSDNFIYLGGYPMEVGVPCSGLKLVMALAAFTVFFMFIGNLRWWGNAIMAALVLPLALFINGLRIMLIGVVGYNYGEAAGRQFHDYSGYITLIICFFILFRIARWVGWKD